MTRSVKESANYVVSGGDDKCVRVWQRNGLDLLIQFAEHQKPVMGVLIDRGQDHLIHSCGADRSIMTYDLKRERRTVIHQLSGNSDGWFTSLAQRTDNELEIVTAGSDGKSCSGIVMSLPRYKTFWTQIGCDSTGCPCHQAVAM